MTTRAARIDMRLERDQKDLLEQAAVCQGQDLTSFILGALLDRARDVVARHRATVLSRRDMKAFLRLLDRPPAPNAALRAAFRRLKEVHD